MPFEMPPSNDDFDIITLNIDEEFPMDPQVDDILFKNDHQFDLASYIGGESTSFLLSPLNDASARRRLMSLSDFGHLDNHHTPVKVKNINIIDKSRIQSNVVQTNAVHDKVAKTPASNRRKRKNLSREFIESSDSDTDKETSTTQNSINHVGDDSKRNKLVKSRKNDDPVWCPDKHNGKTIKQVANCLKEVIDSAESKKNIKISPPPPIQGNSLRNMLKQQLLSDRPVNKNKLLKTMSMPFGSTELSIKPKMVSHPVKRIGVGRGKDIQITAKYYNVNELSDNERDKNCKQDRFHQIYTDSDTTSESSESDSETDDSDIEVNSEPSPPSKDIIKEKKPLSIIEIDTNKGKQHENNFERKISAEELVKKPIDSKAKINDTNKPTAIDNNSMDSTDFAKALVTNAKIASKTKITKLKKNNNLEQQKRIIQSNLLLQNPAKFTMFSIEKNKSSLNGHLSSSSSGISSSEMKSSSSATESKVIEIKTVQVTPKKIEKVPIKSVENKPDKKIETESLENNEKTTSNIEIEVVKVVNENPLIQEDVKPDVVYVEENKIESCAKRKLNIQEYLKRKSFKTFHNGESGARNDFIMNIKTERTENGKKIDSNQENNCNDEEDAPIFAGNSMYEEIIIVSMGCNTDISIPEASFIQTSETMDMKSTVLLSDIQTSVEKANSKISCMSLISSIQDTILKKTHSIEQNGKKETGTDTDGPDGKKKETPEHGENKVIMHLRKDRVRPMRMSTSVQTDPYFQFPPLQKLAPLSKKPSTMVERRMGSIPRDNRNEMHYSHSENKNRAHRNYRGKSHLSESSYYSDEDDKLNQRRSRHSEFMEHNNSRQRRARRESSRYSSSKYDRYISRHRTISRSLSSSSDNSTTSTDSSSSSQSSSSSSSYVSNTSERSLNSYGGSSSKSYYGDDHQYYRKRTTSNNSRHSNFRPVNSNRANSPGLSFLLFYF